MSLWADFSYVGSLIKPILKRTLRSSRPNSGRFSSQGRFTYIVEPLTHGELGDKAGQNRK